MPERDPYRSASRPSDSAHRAMIEGAPRFAPEPMQRSVWPWALIGAAIALAFLFFPN